MRTITFIIALILQIGCPLCWGQETAKKSPKYQFIKITKPVQWNDGMACSVGEIEVVLKYTPKSYVIWNENGKRYEVLRTQAKKITSDEAAAALLVKRQELYAAQNQLTEALTKAMQNQNQVRNAREQLALLKQLQDLVNGGGGGNVRLPVAPAGQGTQHWIKKIVERGQTIQLENGTIWKINPLNKVDAILWLPTERITVIQSDNALYPYKLINSDGGSVAEAKLIAR